MDINNQTQRSGDSCINVQAETITVNGLTYKDVRDIALDVYHSNFHKLSGIARDIASQRAEEITDNFIAKLQTRNSAGIQLAQDPGMQHAIYTAQIEYAKNGDKELGEILVDILIDRSKECNRSLLQIVLNESLIVAPKLTKEQLNALSLVFSLKYTRSLTMNSLVALDHYLAHRIAPFTTLLSKNAACYQHLEFTGCGAVSLGEGHIEGIFSNTYSGVFTKGIPTSDLQKFISIDPGIQSNFIPCLRDSNLIQLNAADDEVLRSKLNNQGLSATLIENIINTYANYRLSKEEIKQDLISRNSCMVELLDVWDNSFMKNMTLTSVGIAIAHAYIRSINGDNDDLSIWIK